MSIGAPFLRCLKTRSENLSPLSLGNLEMEIHVIAGATADCMSSRGQACTTQLYVLSSEETQTLGAWCFQV